MAGGGKIFVYYLYQSLPIIFIPLKDIL